MAGGKETPRQKLIGLMYLVLLALLALQVSSAIIQKFQFLNSSLEIALIDSKQRNEDKVNTIKKAVEERGNKAKEVEILNQANTIRAESMKLIGDIDALKKEIIEKTGGIEENGQYKGAKDEDVVANLMVGDPSTGKKGRAYALKDQLNAFVTKVNQMSSTQFPALALDGKEDPLTKNDPEQKNKDFAFLNFSQTPMIACLAVLSDKQTKIAAMEASILNELSSKVGAADFKFDVILPMYSAKSSVVAAGTDYEADLFVTARSSTITPVMKYRGAELKVENGIGKIKFKASASNFDKEGNAKQTWDASITMPNPTGGDTTFKITGEYIVAKPVLDVKSASVSALYFNCGNDLNIQCPALGANYKPAFSAKGASVITGAEKGSIIVVPTDQKSVTINVSSEGAAIGSKDFPVRQVPKPTIVAKIGGAYVNQKTGVPAPGPQAVMVQAEPDPSFLAALPKEARYRVAAGEVTLARGKRELGTINFSSDNVNLGTLRNQAQSGDRYIIVVKKVQRANFRNEIEDVAISANASVITIPVQ